MKLTANGSGYYVVSVNGVDVSRHTAEREAIEAAVNRELTTQADVVLYRHDYAVRVEQDAPAPAPAPTPTPTPTPTPSVVFSTAFDMPEWTQGGGSDPAPTTDAVLHYGDWTAGGQGDQILVAANRPGSAGCGFRHYRGVGSNVCGGGLKITLPAPLTEMWVRQWMRNNLAYSGGRPSYTKDHYWNVGGNFFIFGHQGGAWGLHTSAGSANIPSSIAYPATDDGQWHCYEYYARQSGGGYVEMWIDGVLCLQRAVNLGSTPWAYLALGDNQSSVVTAGYTDYDDFAVSSTGRIGL